MVVHLDGKMVEWKAVTMVELLVESWVEWMVDLLAGRWAV